MPHQRPHEFPPELLPDRPFDVWNVPRVFAHTVFSHLRDHRRAPRGTPPPGPVFVVGSPRSGTTFVGSALAKVPGVTYQFEPVAVKAAVPYIWSGTWSERTGARVVRFTHGMLKVIDFEWGRTLVEKTPRNVFIVERLARWYPGARFLGLIRDGRDVAASWARQPWLQEEPPGRRRYEPGGYAYGPRPPFWVEPERVDEFRTTTTAHRCIWGWRAHTERWLAAKASLDASRWLELRYEDLVVDPTEASRQLTDFLDLDRRASTVLGEALAAATPASIGSWKDSEVAHDDRALTEATGLLADLGYV